MMTQRGREQGLEKPYHGDIAVILPLAAAIARCGTRYIIAGRISS
jgi:hypothetical protein